MKLTFKTSLLTAFTLLLTYSCSKDPEVPKPPEIEYPEVTKTIEDLRNLVTGEEAYEVPANFVFKGVVVSNQGESNNFYRALYLQSGEVAIKISCDKDAFYETLVEGQEVFVKADGLFVCKYYDTYTLGYQASGDKFKVSLISAEKQEIVLVGGDKDKHITPKEFNDLSTLSPDMVGTLVKVNNVQVTESDRNKLLGDADNQGYTTLSFTTAEGNKVQISNNNYSNFNDQKVPDGSGSITGVLNTFGSDFQIANRSMDDFDLTGERFDIQTPDVPSPNKTIAEIKALVTGTDAVAIPEGFAFDAIVTSNQGESGNFYKAIFVEDETGAIKISCDNGVYETYTIGQKVIVKLDGLYVGGYNSNYMIGSGPDASYTVALIADANVESTVIKVDGGTAIEPTIVAINAITDDMVGQLIKIENVQVLSEDLQKTITSGLTLSDINLNRISLYVSNYANSLKNIPTPQLSGSIAAILYKGDNGYSLTLRLESDINMTADRFDDGTTAPVGTPGINEGTYTGNAASDLFISEYVEGGSNNKYLELFNGTGADIDLSNYAIKVAANGKTFAEVNAIQLSGTLPNGATFVIANAGAALTLPEGITTNTTLSTATYFNGNDAIALIKNSNIIDVFGVEGEDPGAAWPIGETAEATKDHTLIRIESVTSPSSTWNKAEWQIKDKDDVANIGTHSFNP